MKFAAIIAIGSLVAACSAHSVVPDVETHPGGLLDIRPYKLTTADIAAVKAGVKDVLKDPNSALFDEDRFVAAGDPKGTATVCGYVNAKNSYGGYTGREPFIGRLTTEAGKGLKFWDVAIGDGKYGPEILAGMCRDRGVELR